MTAKEYVDKLSWQEFEEIKAFKDKNPYFFQFLAEPCKDVITVATFAMQCREAGIPDELTKTAGSLHYLVEAITARAYRNV